MPKKTEKNLIVGLDIGTSKVVAIVGEVLADGDLEVIGIGSHPSRGLKKGVVVNIESTVHSIQRAVEEAELMAGCQIHSVYAGIAGSHIRSLNSHGIVAIRDKEVVPGDVERVIDAARAVAIRRASGGQGAHGDRCGQCSAEHYQVCAPLRAGSG
jgi:cell division protein FtsA